MKLASIMLIVFILPFIPFFSTSNALQIPSASDGPKIEWEYGGFLCIDGIAMYPREETYTVSVWVFNSL